MVQQFTSVKECGIMKFIISALNNIKSFNEHNHVENY